MKRHGTGRPAGGRSGEVRDDSGGPGNPPVRPGMSESHIQYHILCISDNTYINSPGCFSLCFLGPRPFPNPPTAPQPRTALPDARREVFLLSSSLPKPATGLTWNPCHDNGRVIRPTGTGIASSVSIPVLFLGVLNISAVNAKQSRMPRQGLRPRKLP
jgi:hypothetical protein